ncbi:MAG: GNAT family N-acetyltransferase [Rhizonema sp. PD37]|nr:GNAT family N-acetyltransferase [Rhizonema sp. PD37]
MSPQEHIIFREATPEEDSLIAEHFFRMWLDNGVSEDAVAVDWHDITLDYIKEARRDKFYKAFVAEFSGLIVGSTGCQLFAGLYPNILQPQYRKYGYIWGVYVEARYRRQGIAKQLISMAMDYLKAIACTRVILNTSPLGKPLYESLGFNNGNAMQLDLV